VKNANLTTIEEADAEAERSASSVRASADLNIDLAANDVPPPPVEMNVATAAATVASESPNTAASGGNTIAKASPSHSEEGFNTPVGGAMHRREIFVDVNASPGSTSEDGGSASQCLSSPMLGHGVTGSDLPPSLIPRQFSRSTTGSSTETSPDSHMGVLTPSSSFYGGFEMARYAISTPREGNVVRLPARVIERYESIEMSELDALEGDIVLVDAQDETGWWKCTLLQRGNASNHP